MATNSAKARNGTGSASKPGGSYRGVDLQRPAGAPKTPLATLKRAVEAAVAKNANALARGK